MEQTTPQGGEFQERTLIISNLSATFKKVPSCSSDAHDRPQRRTCITFVVADTAKSIPSTMHTCRPSSGVPHAVGVCCRAGPRPDRQPRPLPGAGAQQGHRHDQGERADTLISGHPVSASIRSTANAAGTAAAGCQCPLYHVLFASTPLLRRLRTPFSCCAPAAMHLPRARVSGPVRCCFRTPVSHLLHSALS